MRDKTVPKEFLPRSYGLKPPSRLVRRIMVESAAEVAACEDAVEVSVETAAVSVLVSADADSLYAVTALLIPHCTTEPTIAPATEEAIACTVLLRI